MFLYSVLALPYPGSLFAYHLFLIARGETTREYLNSHKFAQADRHRPFSQPSLFRNWAAVLVRPRPPTYMRFKAKHDDGDRRLGYDVRKKDRRRNLQGRYSVQGPADGGKGGLEMKQLPPLPPPSSAGPQARPEGGGAGGLGVGLSGAVDRTPR